MAPESQINHVIVEIIMDATETDPKFVVEKVTAQPGRCFEGAENLLRARFTCLCCKTGYVVLPLIMQTTPIRTEMEISVAEDDPTSIQQVVEHANEGEKGSILDEVADSLEEPRQGNGFDDFKMEAELSLREDSFEMAPMENQAHADQVTDLEELPPKRPLDEVVGSDEGERQTDRLEDSEMETDLTLSMDVDQDSVEMPQVKPQTRAEQMSESEESKVLTQSEERSLKLKCLQSEVVVRLVRIDEEAREMDASVAPVGPQQRNVEGGFYTCDICKASMKFRSYLIRHMNIHLGIRFSCSECQESFSRKFHLAMHKKRAHQSEFRICEVCGRSQTWTKAKYYSHLRRRHPRFHNKESQPKVENFNGVDFLCIYCEPQATFTSFEELREHLGDTHDRNFACKRCPKAFTKTCNLKDHIDTVHEQKKFKCPKCAKVFTRKTYLCTHLPTHK